MLNEKVKAEVKEYVECYARINSDFYDTKVILPDGKEINIMSFIPRSASPYGDYEPGWGPNMEGIRMEVGAEFTDEEWEELEEYAYEIANQLVKHTISRWSEEYGARIDYGTYTECTEEEFKQAVDYLLNAPRYQREENFDYILIDTRIKENGEDD